MKYLLIIPFLLAMSATTSVMGQDTINIKTVKTTAVDPKDEPLIVVRADAVDYEIENASLNTIDPDWIDSVEVLKDDTAVKAFGEKGENGVVIISFKEDNEAAATFLEMLKKNIK